MSSSSSPSPSTSSSSSTPSFSSSSSVDAWSVREGRATMSVPPSQRGEVKPGQVADGAQAVFYNKVQVFNRDLSILAIQTFVDELKQEYAAACDKLRIKQQKAAEKQTNATDANKQDDSTSTSASSGPPPPPHSYPLVSLIPRSADAAFPGISFVEVLGASGLRSLRYFQEINGVQNGIVNDMSSSAVEAIRYNIELNGLTQQQLIPTQMDGVSLLSLFRPPPMAPPSYKRPQMIDLDPYGSAVEFLDSAVQAIDEGGLLAITCTDKAVLCGNHSETCYSKYGVMPLKGAWCHEQAIRIVLSSIQSAANRYKRYIKPLLAMSIDFYVRVFVRVYTSSLEVKKTASEMSMVYECMGCSSFHLSPLGRLKYERNNYKYSVGQGPPTNIQCSECDGKFKVGGPIYTGKLHDVNFVNKMIAHVESNPDKFATSPRIIGQLTVIQSELETPFYYSMPSLFQTLNSSCPKIQILRSAIINAGYQVSQSHSLSTAIKSPIPNNILWDIMRCFIRDNPQEKPPQPDSPGARILSRAPTYQANFKLVAGSDLSVKATGVAKFLPNPEDHWGPKARAGKRKNDDNDEPIDQYKKAKLNQNKNVKRRPCKSFTETGACKFNDRCKFSHAITNNSNTSSNTDENATAQESSETN